MSENGTIKPFDAGGYFPIHNYVFDVCMPQLSNAGWRILCVAIRKTWGWVGKKEPNAMGRETWDQISYSQFQQASGLASSASVAKGIQECLELRYLIRKQIGSKTGIGSPIFAYALNVSYEVPATVSEAGTPKHKRPASESESGQSIPASKNEVVPASLSEDTKVKEIQSKDESKGIPSLWEMILMDLALQMEKTTFNSWLFRTRLLAVDDGTWTVHAASARAADWLNNRMMPMIARTVERHAPGVKVRFVA